MGHGLGPGTVAAGPGTRLNTIDLAGTGSHHARMACECAVDTIVGRLRHRPGETLGRHRHDCGFAALVLGGSYIEAGDRGRMRVAAGDVILHGPYESHLDAVAGCGAEVLILPWSDAVDSPLGKIDDADAIARLAGRDIHQAAALLRTTLRTAPMAVGDWPDRLAADLQRDPNLGLREWADHAGLRPETISRGFRQVFGITAVEFRMRSRLLKALARMPDGGTLAGIALDAGFADQAHFSRSFRDLTGMAPRRWLASRMVAARQWSSPCASGGLALSRRPPIAGIQ